MDNEEKPLVDEKEVFGIEVYVVVEVRGGAEDADTGMNPGGTDGTVVVEAGLDKGGCICGWAEVVGCWV